MATGELGMLSLLQKYNKALLPDNFFRCATKFPQSAALYDQAPSEGVIDFER